MGGGQLTAVVEAKRVTAPLDLYDLADEGEGNRITVGLEAHQVVLGNDAGGAGLEPEAWLTGSGQEVLALAHEALDRSLVSGPMEAGVSNAGHPLSQLRIEVGLVDETAPGQEIALDIFYPAFHLALCLGTVGTAQPRLEAPVLGKGLERRVPLCLTALARLTDCARPIIEVLAGVPAEVLERPLVGFQEQGQPFIGKGTVDTTAGE